MKTANSLITLILLLVAVLSGATNSPLSASIEDDGYTYPDDASEEEKQEIDEREQEAWEDAGRPGEIDDPEEEAEEADENDDSTVYDDNPDLNGDGVTTPEEYQKFTDAAVALADRLAESEEELITCLDGFTKVQDEDDCPGATSLPLCDGSFQDCVTVSGDVCEAGSTEHKCKLPNELEGPITFGIPFIEPIEVTQQKKPNPYCDLVPDGFQVSCHDRKDASDETGLYTCNDGTHKVDWRDCSDVSGYDYEGPPAYCTTLGCQNSPPDPQNGCNDGLIQIGSTCQPKKEKWWECDVPWYMTCDSQAKKKDDSRDTTKVIQKTTVINSATAAATATTTPTSAEVSSCRLDGSTDGILQKFDTVKYQACGLYIDGQKAYSDGFVAGCTQVGNTQLICQSFIESNIFNTKIQTTQTSTQNPHAAAQSTEQGITPITVDK